ncbi:MAG: UDP-N-acetylmuramate--L-alanine ligase [Clostridia bacterium]|nr:UDP-N-acetylmuramate--L-alanine ligase [Clostridia bacterium]
MPDLHLSSVHFIGVGGISLSALAKLMLKLDIRVSGSDTVYSPAIIELMEKGADIWIGSKPELIGKPDLAVYSSAIADCDKELVFCRSSGIPVFERHLFLGRIAAAFPNTIAISGTHGKTTACGLLCAIFKHANKAFCGHVGGGVGNGIGNLYYSGDDFFVTEACEYRRSLLSVKANIAVVLNAESDHPDTYKSLSEIFETFDEFLFGKKECLPLVCGDSDYYKKHLLSSSRRAITFGSSPSDDFFITEIEECSGGCYSFAISYLGENITDIKLGIPGRHNVYNAAAAAAVSYLLHIDGQTIKQAIENFQGIKRRFERKGMIKGAEVIHDYAHHPSEIRAVLESAVKMTDGRLITVFQPHTYSRTAMLIDDFCRVFNGCDEVYIVKEYSARENSSQGMSAYDLFKRLENRNSFYYEEILSLAADLIKKTRAGDMILVLGAGDIEKLCDLLV